MQLLSADPTIFSKKNQINFLPMKFLKNGPQKLFIIGPDPLISQSSPDHSPQPRIDFSYYEIWGLESVLLSVILSLLIQAEIEFAVHTTQKLI